MTITLNPESLEKAAAVLSIVMEFNSFELMPGETRAVTISSADNASSRCNRFARATITAYLEAEAAAGIDK